MYSKPTIGTARCIESASFSRDDGISASGSESTSRFTATKWTDDITPT
jgi:hypothetical protein